MAERVFLPVGRGVSTDLHLYSQHHTLEEADTTHNKVTWACRWWCMVASILKAQTENLLA